MTNHFYQVIRGKTIYVIHEYMYGVRSNNSVYKPLDELNRDLRNIPRHFSQLATIHGSDKTVKNAADI